jgi:hypothetical protein
MKPNRESGRDLATPVILSEAAVTRNEAAVTRNEAAVTLGEAAVILSEAKDLVVATTGSFGPMRQDGGPQDDEGRCARTAALRMTKADGKMTAFRMTFSRSPS